MRNTRHRITVAITLALGLTSPSPNTHAGQERVALRFVSSTTVGQPDNYRLSTNSSGMEPYWLDLDVQPTSGRIVWRYDTQLTADWNDDDVAVDAHVPITVRWGYPDTSRTFSVVQWRQGLIVEPVLQLDFDKLFNTPGQYWFGLVPFQSPTGTHPRRIPPSTSIRLAWNVTLPIDTTDSFDPLVLDFPVAVILPDSPMDSVTFSETFRPFPCIRAVVSGTFVGTASLSVKSDTVCVRYSSDESTNYPCWAMADSFRCISSTDSVRVNVITDCRGYGEIPAVLCPLTSRGSNSATLGLRIRQLSIAVTFTCRGADSTLTTTITDRSFHIVSQESSLERSRDDAIFGIPAGLEPLRILSPDPNSSCAVNSSCTISWSGLDDALLSCCGSPRLDLTYAGIAPDSTEACAGDIALGQSVSGTEGSHDWTISNDPSGCFDGSTPIVIRARIYCSETAETLATAVSDSVTISSGGASR